MDETELQELADRYASVGRRLPDDHERLRLHFSDFVVDESGRFWVRTERGDARATILHLFDKEGTFLGEVTLPVALKHRRRAARAFDISNDRLVAVTVDEPGIEQVHLYRIRWTAG